MEKKPKPPVPPKPKLTPQLCRKPTIATTDSHTVATEGTAEDKDLTTDTQADEHNIYDNNFLSINQQKDRPISSSGSSLTSSVIADPCVPSTPSPNNDCVADSSVPADSDDMQSADMSSQSAAGNNTCSDSELTKRSTEANSSDEASKASETVDAPNVHIDTNIHPQTALTDNKVLTESLRPPPRIKKLRKTMRRDSDAAERETVILKEKEHTETITEREKKHTETLTPREKEHTETLTPREKEHTETLAPREKKHTETLTRRQDEQTETVTLREKEQADTPERCSKPPRGTFMSVLGGLLASSGEKEIAVKRASRRPVPRPRSKSATAATGLLNLDATSSTIIHTSDLAVSKRIGDTNQSASPVPKPRNSLVIQDVEKQEVETGSSDEQLETSANLIVSVSYCGETGQVETEHVEKNAHTKADHNYGQVWNNRTQPPPLSHTKSFSVVSEFISNNKPVCRTNSSPAASSNPKIKPKRPAVPPPPIPSALVKRKLVPSRPPPPVPTAHKITAPSNVDSEKTTHYSSSIIQDSQALTESIYSEIEDNIYHEADDIVVGVSDEPQTGADSETHAHISSNLLPVQSEQPVHSSDDSESIASRGSQEYMVPVSRKEVWPEGNAPNPNMSAVTFTFDPVTKSDTLKSASSNIYEDLDTSSDDDGFSYHSRRADDVYSDYLDETFENEDSVKAGSSSESEAESEEAAETKLVKQKAKLHNVAQEIVSSEKEFLDKLILLNIDFRKYISDKSEEYGETIIPASSMNKILNHLPQLTNVNEELLKDLEQRLANWDEHPKIADVFVKKGPFLRMYTMYISNFQNMTTELDEAVKEYPLFAETLKEFERSERCKNLQLRHYMLKPIQRIPQYRLLLSAYQKYLPEDSPDIEDTHSALKIVSEVADHANEAMKQNDSLQSLLELQNLLIGEFTVIEPSRVLVKRGDVHKQSRKELQSRTLFLFNDYLVITTAQPNGYYKINYALPLQNMQVTKSTKEEFQKEFTIITKKKSFRSVTSTPKERDDWVNILEATIAERERKLGTYRQGLMDSTNSREYVLGEVAPVWIPDNRVTMCMKCSVTFTFTNRRHHCRACGNVVCGGCSAFKAPLKYEDHQPMRVCETCFNKLYEAAESSSTTLKVPAAKSGFTRGRATAKNSPRIKPKVLQEVHANDEGEVSGYLSVRVKKRHWNKYWFVLKDKVLYKYLACEDASAIESKPLLGYKVAQVGTSYEGVHKDVMFRLHHPSMDIIEPILFKTETAQAAERWIEKMTESTTA